ncbi:MAG TPA: hypothetical protein VFO67_08610, partial [Gemmatimonadales bacterium]|nr:hypothetical protein [Gemmatimonadales bacterium]
MPTGPQTRKPIGTTSEAPLAQGGGRLPQQRLGALMPCHGVEPHRAGQERKQPAARFLDQTLLLARQRAGVELGDAARLGF